MMLFEHFNPAPLDPNKETMAVIFNGITKNTRHIYGFGLKILEVLEDKYNLVYIGQADLEFAKSKKNSYHFDKKHFDHIRDDKFVRVREDVESKAKNYAVLTEEYSKCFKDLKVDRFILLNDILFILPMTSYVNKQLDPDLHVLENEFCDYLGSDEKKLKIIDDTNRYIVHEKFLHAVSLLAFSTYEKAMFFNLIKYFHAKDPIKKLYAFIIDPAFYTPFFDLQGIPAEYFYFANDRRGTRNFKRFPIAELQHLVYEKEQEEDSIMSFMDEEVVQDKNMMFVGSIIQKKENRKTCWREFLREFRDEDSNLFIPLRNNGIVTSDRQASLFKSKLMTKKESDPEIKELYDQIVNHPQWRGHCLPDELPGLLKKHKYGLILRCVSFNDSLNFRLIYYLSLNVLPFLDIDYDPECLQVPLVFQNCLGVADEVDIFTRIDYYNEYPEEREQLLSDMKKYYHIDTFANTWKEKVGAYFE